MGKRKQEPDDDLIVPVPLDRKPITREYLRVARDRVGQLRTALEMADGAARTDVVTAGQVSRIVALHKSACEIERELRRMLGEPT